MSTEPNEPTHAETKRALDVALYALTLVCGEDASRILAVAADRMPAEVPRG